MERKLKSKIAAGLFIGGLAIGSATLVRTALADGTFALSGVVPVVTTLSVLWSNPNIGLGSSAAGGGVTNSVLAAFQVYSNAPAGFTISSYSTNTGVLIGTTVNTNTVAYKAALFGTLADAAAGTNFLAVGTGTSAFATPGANLAGTVSLLTTGAMTTVTDTSAGSPYYLTIQTPAATDLMADSYTDTLNVTISSP